jgi:hypothetical protein
MQAAGFQASKTSDLTGLFVGDDGSRHYVRETPSDAVWVAERAAQPGERPGWVTVFVGKRSGDAFTGTHVDVPKGIDRGSGSFLARLQGAKRELRIRGLAAGRTHTLAPEYTLDWDLFASRIAQKLDDHVVGYSYAIAHNGAILRSGAGGARQIQINAQWSPFTTGTLVQTASTAKTISAAAMIKALHDRGLTVDAKVLPFLPSTRSPSASCSTTRAAFRAARKAARRPAATAPTRTSACSRSWPRGARSPATGTTTTRRTTSCACWCRSSRTRPR